jgi:hypothetical protein
VFGTGIRLCCVKALHSAFDESGTVPNSSFKATDKHRRRSLISIGPYLIDLNLF